MTILRTKIIIAWWLLSLSGICQAQKTKHPFMVCQSLSEIQAHSGKEIRVVGQLARSYRLPQAPYILLLPNKEWIFLGNDTVLKDVDTKHNFILVEGTVSFQNTAFNLAKFSNTPLSPLLTRYIDPELQEKKPAQIIQNQPYFSSINKIQSIATCTTSQDIKQHLGHWVALFGKLSTDKANTLHYQSTSWAFHLPLTTPPVHCQDKLGIVFVKFDQPNTPPSEILSHRVLPVCQSAEDIKAHLGEIVALSGKIKNKKIKGVSHALLKTSARTCVYFYNPPPALELTNRTGKKTQMIVCLQNYDAPTFFQLSFHFNRPSLGQKAYMSKVFWWDF
ncbi:hypothetical protein [Microscilla marina]|uniref:Uncharacterized protein n=1 Tax=Microscilla marina ATCC 23134 TaxID=313606 RepID=A1ZPM7_MICM2|nr:hypothetical protein [Microscilla marina]EAY27766.1 hypothetical protein M23134_03835 [Microscilla marina ATCC 23134]